MNIIDKKIDDLTPYENNPRKNDGAVSKVAASIREFGFKVPIVIDRNGVIVCGHTRYKAAADLGMTSVPCIIADDLTDDQIKAFRLADNKVSEFAEWDFDKLIEELSDISDFDMSEFGFDVSEFSDDEDPEIVEDDFDGEADERTVVGDMYQLGDHFLICGDANDPNVLDRLLNGNRADLVLTDPPYGINVVSKENKVGFGTAGKNKIANCGEYKPIIGDDTTDTARDNYNLIVSYSDNQIIFGGNYFTDFLPPSRCWVVWDKENTGNFADAELAWTSFQRGVRVYRWLWNGLFRKGDRDSEGVKRVHPTQKPVGMLSMILNDFSEKNNIILDCFGGSGSTLIACEQLERRCYMIELDPHYCDVIVARWEKFTGKQAVKMG